MEFKDTRDHKDRQELWEVKVPQDPLDFQDPQGPPDHQDPRHPPVLQAHAALYHPQENKLE